MKHTRFRFRLGWRRMHLADGMLLLFMVVLLIQTGHNLFFHELAQGDSVELDVVLRTTTASIFGYFISAGVQGRSLNTAVRTTNKIGFSTPQEDGPVDSLEGVSAPVSQAERPDQPALEETQEADRLGRQIVIVGSIGLAALGLLILARNCEQSSQESLATLSQLRDFVSGSVGFLIGHGGGKQEG